jgi:hypothetical protein
MFRILREYLVSPSLTPRMGVCASAGSPYLVARVYKLLQSQPALSPEPVRNARDAPPSASALSSYWKEPGMNRGAACAKSDAHD